MSLTCAILIVGVVFSRGSTRWTLRLVSVPG
jgi:hypothetical protein